MLSFHSADFQWNKCYFIGTNQANGQVEWNKPTPNEIRFSNGKPLDWVSFYWSLFDCTGEPFLVRRQFFFFFWACLFRKLIPLGQDSAMAQEHFPLYFVHKVHEDWTHEEINRPLQTVQAEFKLVKQVTACHGTMPKSCLIWVGSIFLNCRPKIIFEGQLWSA